MSAAEPLDAHALAEACATAMMASDEASRHLGMRIESIAPGSAVLSMAIAPFMLNGHGIAHGGFVFALADSAFAFACNGRDERTVGQQASIAYIAPTRLGDTLRASARELHRRARSGLYDVQVTNQRGELVAEFRGHCRVVAGRVLPG
ncbi:phenylacetic acid degradation protein PaaD [Aureimonas ureilytica]|uniref:Phenylacetic acid degradation protein PaaD n=1 Tax=Aureimonas ureilytica TaxID=401562 RepID=A0A175RBY5_9HYPH|nr:hydroxyphenylacetyl-CoA thioesterase PaaI [Aureimonas ureilytica]KTQ96308.1 phenylacetic acid degradation protein PaaD [Aureimonas ureilytica]